MDVIIMTEHKDNYFWVYDIRKDAGEECPVAAPAKTLRPSYHHIDNVEVDNVQMTRSHKIEVWIALLVAVVLIVTLALIRWQRQKAISLQGAILVQDSDPRKQRPIAGVTISAGDLATSDTASDSAGFFRLSLRKPIRQGHAIVLLFRHPQYNPLDLNDFVDQQALRRPSRSADRQYCSGESTRGEGRERADKVYGQNQDRSECGECS